MNPAIEQLRQERIHKAELEAQLTQGQEIVANLQKLDATTIQAFSSLIQFMQGHVSRTEVVNQLETIGTPDAFKVMSAVNDMHSTLKKKNVDLSPVTQVMQAILEQVSQLPKELPEQKDEVAISNLSSIIEKFDDLEDAINAVADKELPTPKVNVDAPVVNVPETQVNVEAPDFATLEKPLKDVVKAVKSIVIPEPEKVDLSKVEKELKTSNKHLKELLDKPMGGSGSGGHTTPYQDSTGNPVYVELSLDLQVDDTGTYTYLGNATPGTATSEAMWRIKRVTNATGVITHADGTSEFTKEWDERASYSY